MGRFKDLEIEKLDNVFTLEEAERLEHARIQPTLRLVVDDKDAGDCASPLDFAAAYFERHQSHLITQNL